jgi:flagellar biosynthetic protein FliP
VRTVSLSTLVRSVFVAMALVLAVGVGGARGQLIEDAMRDISPANVMTPGTVLGGPRVEGMGGLKGESVNPISILASAAEALPGQADPMTGEKRAGLSTAVNVVVVLTVIGLVPTIMLMCTCFLRIVIVLSLLKQALGTAQMPPGQVMLGLSLVLSLLVMTPTIDRVNLEAIGPYKRGEVKTYDELWDRAKQPLRDFMFDQIEATGNWSSVYAMLNYRGFDTSDPSRLTRADVDMVSLVPAFVLSELKTAFLMGFRIYLPFLIIDMVISALLISMSMMMLPPVLISLPFKLLLFVLVDGWQLVCGSLMTSFVTHPVVTKQASALVEGVGWFGGGAGAAMGFG